MSDNDKPQRIQRSDLAVPATSAKFFEKARISQVDSIFFDLEDAVAPDRKRGARQLAIDAINDMDWGAKIIAVRVNSVDSEWGYRDIIDLAENCPRLDMVLLPKVGCAMDIKFAEMLLSGIELDKRRDKRVGLEALIESARGMVNIAEIAAASPRLEALVFGVGDYTVDMRTSDDSMGDFNADYPVLRRKGGAGPDDEAYGNQWHYAQARIVTACRANGLRPIDGPYTDFKDAQGYRAAARRARALGFEGKWAIHPTQVELANDVFSPTDQQRQWAKKVVAGMTEAIAQGKGAIQLDGELYDLAHLKLAQNIIARIELIGGNTRMAQP